MARSRAKGSPLRQGNFEGRLAVVTGAGSGIGRATALAFAKRGARVIGADIDAEAAERTAGEAGPAAEAGQVDVSDQDAMEQFAEGVERDHGVPDVVVNNAGIGVSGGFLDTGVEEWERILGVNLWGVIHGSRLFAGQMAAAGKAGHVVNVASLAAFMPSRSLPAYCATKSAVLMLSECMHAELAAKGIGVTCVCPGFTATNIINTARFVGVDEAEEARRRRVGAKLLHRRRYPPERVAAAILRAVERNQAVVVLTAEGRIIRGISRLSPALARASARLDIGSPR